MNAKPITITFLPADKRVTVPPGILLQEAAARAGLDIDLPCGGQGRCGRCRVKIEQGQASPRENPHLTPHQIEQGWALSCLARAQGDLVVMVPPARERARVETTTSRAAAAVRLDWPLQPAVRRAFLELDPPSLEDNAPDLDRLARSVQRSLGLSRLEVDLPLLKKLSQVLRQDSWRATAVLADGPEPARLIDILPGQVKGPLWGVAVDIGTTNVVVYLADLATGRFRDSTSTLNRQVSCGEDIISRIVYSLRPGGLAHLQQLAVDTVNELLKELALKHALATTDIYDMVVAGNTTMIHLFLGLSPRHIREEPYTPLANRLPPVLARELGVDINPGARVYCLPGVAAYVGGDITAGVLSSGLYKRGGLTLFLDVGTNGEIVLGNADWMMTDACSAGPAFEGAGIACGMRATKGAIEDVRLSSRTLEPTLKVVGDVRPLGICGSGLISALAEMMVTGIIDRSGRINLGHIQGVMGEGSRARHGEHGGEYVLVWARDAGAGEDIVLTEVDINNVLRAKGAIYAGIQVMLRHAGLSPQDIQEVLIGGSFGRHIDVEMAILIGLLPDLPWGRFKYLGNTSALGAYQTLLSRQARAKAEELAGKMTYLELIADNSFMEEFTAALFLPHTELDKFPSVKALLRE